MNEATERRLWRTHARRWHCLGGDSGLQRFVVCRYSDLVGLHHPFDLQWHRTNISIRNGSVVGVYHGISLAGSANLVESIHAKWDFYGIWVDRGAVLHSSANQNYSGIHVERGTVESNVVVGNSYGSALRNSTYGSNSLQGNGMNLFDYGGNTSQNNNNCDGSTC